MPFVCFIVRICFYFHFPQICPAAFKFSRFAKMDEELIEYGPIKFLIVKSGGVRVCYYDGRGMSDVQIINIYYVICLFNFNFLCFTCHVLCCHCPVSIFNEVFFLFLQSFLHFLIHL